VSPTEITIPKFGFRPRDYQLPLWNAVLESDKDRLLACWHRRAGKDILCLNMAILEMLENPGMLVWHVLPTAVQGRKAIWDGLTSDGIPFMDYFPKEMIDRKREDYMQIKLSNGSIYQVIGGDQSDRLVGANPRLVIFSEFALMNPTAWDLVRPILRENRGRAIFISTPRGYNTFYDLYQASKESERWFSEKLSITDTQREDGTPLVTEEDVQEEIRDGMPVELTEQEFYVSFNAPLVGAYYGKMLEEMDKEGRICSLPWRKELPVHTAWDLGVSDATAIIFYQEVGDWIHLLDYHAEHGYGVDHYAKVLQDLPYLYKRHTAPHDIRVREWGSSALTRLEIARKLGIKFTVAPKSSTEDGIAAVRMLLSRCKINSDKCQDLLKALQHYRRNFDRKTKTWGKPVHDWSSHPADAMRYLATTVPRRLYEKADKSAWNPRPTFQDCFDSIVGKARKARSRSNRAKRWI